MPSILQTLLLPSTLMLSAAAQSKPGASASAAPAPGKQQIINGWTINDNIAFVNTYSYSMTAAIIGSILLVAAFDIIYRSRRHRSYSTEKGSASAQKTSPLSVAIASYITLPALLGKHARPAPSFCNIALSVPTRLETLLLILYLATNIACLAVPYYGSTSANLSRYVADRAGMLAFGNMPLLIAFAGRNNILIWLTGSSFKTFNVFHKWMGRTCVALAIIHSASYTINETVQVLWLKPLTWAGSAALVAGCAILVQASKTFRQRAYEAFLVIHIILVIAFIVGSYYHIVLHRPLYYLYWLYAAIAVWVFDRLLRIARLLYFNLRWSPSNGFRSTCAQILIDEEGKLLKITARLPTAWPYTAGQYAFLHFGGGFKSKPWESHPFTIYSCSTDAAELSSDNEEVEMASRTLSDMGGKLSDQVAVSDTRLDVKDAPNTITFYVKRRKGITHALSERLLTQPWGTPVERRIWLEGPYGHGLPLNRYDNVHLIVGGIGVTAAVPHLESLLLGAKRNQTLPPPVITMLWVVREEDGWHDILDDINRLAGRDQQRVTVILHVTGKSSKASSQSSLQASSTSSHNFEKKQNNAPLAHISIEYGPRPDLTGIIGDLTCRPGNHAVVAVGPEGMMGACRAGCAAAISKDKGSIDYYPEEFGW